MATKYPALILPTLVPAGNEIVLFQRGLADAIFGSGFPLEFYFDDYDADDNGGTLNQEDYRLLKIGFLTGSSFPMEFIDTFSSFVLEQGVKKGQLPPELYFSDADILPESFVQVVANFPALDFLPSLAIIDPVAARAFIFYVLRKIPWKASVTASKRLWFGPGLDVGDFWFLARENYRDYQLKQQQQQLQSQSQRSTENLKRQVTKQFILQASATAADELE